MDIVTAGVRVCYDEFEFLYSKNIIITEKVNIDYFINGSNVMNIHYNR